MWLWQCDRAKTWDPSDLKRIFRYTQTNFCLGFAYIEYETASDAKTALRHMDGGQIDGQEVMVTMVKPTRGGGPRRHKFDHDSRR